MGEVRSIVTISDLHGAYDKYLQIIKNFDYTVQLGDFGFSYDCLKNVDSERMRFCAGNHDSIWGMTEKPKHYLGDYGYTTLNGISFFFLSGAFSIDKAMRTPGLDWWENEELSYEELSNAIKLYEEVKPEIVLSHDCPTSMAQMIGNRQILESFGYSNCFKSRTQEALQMMFDIHKPSLLVHGHHHLNYSKNYMGCEFICREPLGTFTIKKTI